MIPLLLAWEKILSQGTEDAGERKNGSGTNEDTDASVEPRQWRIPSFLLAPLPGKRKSHKKETNPKGQSKCSPVQIQKSKAIQIILSNNNTII